MGRSVDYLSNAMYKTFLHNVTDEDDSVDEFIARENWQWFKDGLTELLNEVCPSLDILTGKNVRWDGRETQIIAENNLCEIGLSEYCGLVSVSIRVIQDDYVWKYEPLAVRWIHQMWPKIEAKMLERYGSSMLRKVGSFSNGEGVYEQVKQSA